MAAPTTAACVKKALANPEPSTHGPPRPWRAPGGAGPLSEEHRLPPRPTAACSTRRPLTPMYGPAVRRKRFRRSGGFAVLHQCIRPLIGACCAPGHYGYQRACVLISGQASSGAKWVTRVRMRREDRSSISFHPLADLGRKTGLCHRSLLISAVPLFVP
jgi:hypothetical protein